MRSLLTLVVLLAACAGPPSQRLTWRESWELVGLGDDGTLFTARVTRANSGLLRGQAHLHAQVLPVRSSAVALRRSVPPQAVELSEDGQSMRLAYNRMELRDNTWTLSIREGQQAMDATWHLSRQAPELAPVTLVEGQRQWLLGAPMPLAQLSGAWSAGDQGALVRGSALLLRQSSDTWPSSQRGRRSFYLLADGYALAVEQVGAATLAWLATETGIEVARTARFVRDGRKLRISLEPDLPVTVTMRGGKSETSLQPWGHLLALERTAVRAAFGWPQHSWNRGRAVLTREGVELRSHGLLVERGPQAGDEL